MKKLYFFTMLSIMLLAVTGAMAQKKTKFKAGARKAAALDGKRYMALKTNVLYDACALLNLSLIHILSNIRDVIPFPRTPRNADF